MHWVQNKHVRRYHQHYDGSGHIWQGPFKAFPNQAFDGAALRRTESRAGRVGAAGGTVGLVERPLMEETIDPCVIVLKAAE